MNKVLIATCCFCFMLACGSKKEPESKQQQVNATSTAASIATINYTVVKRYPHDETAFTEGLLFHDGKLYESTGSPDNMPETQSFIGSVDLNTGKIDKKVELDRSIYFGEGIVFLNNRVYQLTYKNKLGFIYDAKNFKKSGQFTYENEEGWGMTTDDSSLIMSDGTSHLTYLDPFTLKPMRTLTVTENGFEVKYLNELEYVNGFIYANIWLTNSIVKIDAKNGKIVGKIDVLGLANDIKYTHPHSAELNGIAYNPSNGHLYITGKLWPSIYELSIVE